MPRRSIFRDLCALLPRWQGFYPLTRAKPPTRLYPDLADAIRDAAPVATPFSELGPHVAPDKFRELEAIEAEEIAAARDRREDRSRALWCHAPGCLELRRCIGRGTRDGCQSLAPHLDPMADVAFGKRKVPPPPPPPVKVHDIMRLCTGDELELLTQAKAIRDAGGTPAVVNWDLV